MTKSHRICVVTGISGATGSVIGTTLLEQGYTVVGTLRPESAPARLEAIGKQTYRIAMDPLDSDAVTAAIREIESELGSIQIWINTIGGFDMGQTVEAYPVESWERLWRLNFLSALITSQGILPRFRENGFGRLIHFGSAAALEGMPLAGPYLVSKAAVHSLTRAIAAEADPDITCNAILPDIIDTAANRAAMPDADFSTWNTPRQIAEQISALIRQNTNGELIQL